MICNRGDPFIEAHCFQAASVIVLQSVLIEIRHIAGAATVLHNAGGAVGIPNLRDLAGVRKGMSCCQINRDGDLV